MCMFLRVYYACYVVGCHQAAEASGLWHRHDSLNSVAGVCVCVRFCVFITHVK